MSEQRVTYLKKRAWNVARKKIVTSEEIFTKQLCELQIMIATQRAETEYRMFQLTAEVQQKRRHWWQG